ncbi:Gfo/Idh/MocA family oxidoreductase [Rubellimicrobium rubrum]|uniref:Gfo/Idh/MocA family oxidoreductase n=1 Tax=Rubellimicrobium rubrum TaxID=2585369 RepID=A0A5C4MSN2_9RHOB|nr:Gfo/Idh/MocA family oxidoreductase [Rubellimicrobium rubrum]TNC48576.1 Gfo/Idh/MocA family oxidoreductase [Rubellimicrobium rubrum]
MRTLNYGLVGCGMMGHEHLRNIALVPGVRVAAVHDPVEAQAQAMAHQAGGAEVAPSFDALIARPDLDALVIASPNDLHMPQLLRVAATRPLPVLVEKPLFVSAEDRAGVDRLARSYPAPIWVAMEYRYMPPIAAFVAEAQAATGGVRMLTIREHRYPFLAKIGNWNRFNSRTGGTFVEKCCHFFDLMRLILGSEPVRVMASGGQAVNHKDERYDGAAPDIWDHGYVLVDFESGAKAMLELCMFAEGSRYQEELTVVGPTGKLECQVPGPSRFWPPELGDPPVPRLIASPRWPKGPMSCEVPVAPALLDAGDHNGGTFYQHLRFAAVVRGEARPDVTLQDGLRATAMGFAAEASARSGQSVAF